MSLWRIAWRSIQQRGLASSLTGMSMALGVMLVVAVLVIHGVINDSFLNNSSLGYNVLVGAKGGRLELVLNSVYYLARPVENVPYSYYQEFVDPSRAAGPTGKTQKPARHLSLPRSERIVNGKTGAPRRRCPDNGQHGERMRPPLT